MTPAWVLCLDPPSPGGDPARKVGGLSLALRLALDAQAGGAQAIVASTPELVRLLGDPRLKIPAVSDVPEGASVVHVKATYLVHRALLREIGERAQSGTLEKSTELSSQKLTLPPPYGFEGVDVEGRVTARRAERLLFRALRKPQDGWTARYLNRYLSLALSRFLVKTPLTPNQVSVGILAIGLCGAWLASFGDYPRVVAGALLFQAQSVLDGCDGEMSRVTYRGSHAGEWLDTVGDDVTNYAFFGALGLGLFRTSGHALYLSAGLLAVTAGMIASGIEYRYLIAIGSGDLLKYPLSQGEGTGKLAAIQPLFKRDTFVFLTLLAAAAGVGGPMLCIFALGAVGVLVSVIRTELRLKRERHASVGATP